VAQPSGTRTMIDKKTEVKRLPQTEIVTSVSKASSARDMKKALLEESQQASRNEYEVSRTGSSLMRARQQRLQTKIREEAGIVEYDEDHQDQEQLGSKGQQREQNKLSRGGENIEYGQEQVYTKGSEMGVYAGNWSEDETEIQQEVQQEDEWSRKKRYKENEFMYDSDKSPRLYITKKMYYPSGHDWMDNMTSREVILYTKKDEVEVEEEGDEDYVQRRLAAANATKKKKEEYFVIENNWMDDMTTEDVLYHRNFSVSPKMARQGVEDGTMTRNLEGTASAGVVEDSDVEGMLHTSKAVKSLMKHKMFVAAGKIFASDVGILKNEGDSKK